MVSDQCWLAAHGRTWIRHNGTRPGLRAPTLYQRGDDAPRDRHRYRWHVERPQHSHLGQRHNRLRLRFQTLRRMGSEPHYTVARPLWRARRHYHWHVERNSLCIHSQLKSPSSSEVASMLEGVIHHCTEMEVDRQYVWAWANCTTPRGSRARRWRRTSRRAAFMKCFSARIRPLPSSQADWPQPTTTWPCCTVARPSQWSAGGLRTGARHPRQVIPRESERSRVQLKPGGRVAKLRKRFGCRSPDKRGIGLFPAGDRRAARSV